MSTIPAFPAELGPQSPESRTDAASRYMSTLQQIGTDAASRYMSTLQQIGTDAASRYMSTLQQIGTDAIEAIRVLAHEHPDMVREDGDLARVLFGPVDRLMSPVCTMGYIASSTTLTLTDELLTGDPHRQLEALDGEAGRVAAASLGFLLALAKTASEPGPAGAAAVRVLDGMGRGAEVLCELRDRSMWTGAAHEVEQAIGADGLFTAAADLGLIDEAAPRSAAVRQALAELEAAE